MHLGTGAGRRRIPSDDHTAGLPALRRDAADGAALALRPTSPKSL